MTTALEFFEQGKLFAALQAAIEQVRQDPTDLESRLELVSYLCFEGDLERAEKHIQVMLQQAPDMAADLLVQRSLLRGEAARRQCFEERRLPRFVDTPSEAMQAMLKAHVEMRENPVESAALVQTVLRRQPAPRGNCDGEAFAGFRDCDDLTATFLEAITIGGEYFWVPLESLRCMDLCELSAPLDVIWRRAELTTQDHTTVTAFLPALYYGSWTSDDELIRLGRAADFSSGEGLPVQGTGGRTYLVGEQRRPLSMMRTITFEGFDRQDSDAR